MILNRQRVLGGFILSWVLAIGNVAAYGCNYLTDLTNLTVCPGDAAVFSATPSGPAPLKLSWYKNNTLIPGETNETLTVSNAGPADTGVYTVILEGGFNNVTNTAALTVNMPLQLADLASQTNALGTTAVFSAVASGNGPFTYVWKKNGTVIDGQTGSSLVLTNLSYADDGLYRAEAAGPCNTGSASASLHVNRPPTVNLYNPTNGAVFLSPASFPLLANALDSDGEITNVEFFCSSSKLGEAPAAAFYTTNLAAYILQLTNLPPGANVFTAVATDNFGSTGTSAPVKVVITASLPITAQVPLYDPQHDPHFIQQVTVSNPTPAAFDRVRIFVYNLTNQPAITVFNAAGITNGVPYVDVPGPVPPGGALTATIIYNSPKRVAPRPVLEAVLVAGVGPAAAQPIGTQKRINRGLRLVDQTFMVEFASLSNRTYVVEYSADLATWKVSQPPITGSGSWIQWIDLGPPLTESAVSAASRRFYRVIELNP